MGAWDLRSEAIFLSNITQYLHEGNSEVESLFQASEGNEGLSGKAAGCHLTERFLVLSRRAIAREATHKQVDALTSIFTYPGDTAARAGI